MKRRLCGIAAVLLILLLSACGRNSSENAVAPTESRSVSPSPTEEKGEPGEETGDMELKLKIGDTEVSVRWEDNGSVQALRELVTKEPLTVSMSMYGGFEQVGSLGTTLPRQDKETVTEAGDIVLYSGNQIVVFYGSNSWAYTRLGKITDRTASEMKDLLGNGNVSITISTE